MVKPGQFQSHCNKSHGCRTANIIKTYYLWSTAEVMSPSWFSVLLVMTSSFLQWV